MSYIFGDGFDCYAATADAIAGYWDSGLGSNANLTLQPGRFAGGQCYQFIGVGMVLWTKSSAVNDAVHHVSIAYRQTSALSGTILGLYLQFIDNVTNQCCIVFRSDGAILLTSATPAGTTLATYAGAVTAQNAWFQFEFEVVINNVSGSFKVRKNGSAADDHSTTGINTRPGANAYANKITIGQQTGLSWQIDDLLWRSDATSLAWLGDIRCFTRMPASDASAQFARAPNNYLTWASATVTSSAATTANRVSATAVTAPVSGVLASLIVNLQSAATGNVRMAVYDATGASGSPGNLIANTTSSAIVNPAAGVNTFTVAGGAQLTKGVVYWVAIHGDVVVTILSPASGTTSYFLNQTYASGFPATMSGATQTGTGGWGSLGMNITPNNASLVNETLQDGTTSYVYDATAGHADLYNIAALSPSPVTVHAVTTRGFVAKSDAGARSGAMQLRGGVNPTTWNPSDKDAAMTLSNGNLTATASTTGAVRATSGQSSGKFYWEITATTFLNAPSFMGLATATAVFANGYGQSGVLGITRSALVYVDNTAIASLTTITNGTVICFAVDFTSKLFWIRRGAAGQWNESGTANPATGTAGYAMGTIGGGTVVGYPYFYENGSGDSVTANFGLSGFVGAVPAGFAAGFGAAGTTVAGPTLALSSSFLWTWRTDTLNPNGSVAWTPTAVDAVQVGPSVVS